MSGAELGLILLGWALALASPGPATLTIASTAMASGRSTALALAAGVATGSAAWGVVAAVGLGTIMLSTAWAVETLRYVGAAYLLWLAWKSLRSALRSKPRANSRVAPQMLHTAYIRGLMIHLTNPKAVLFWGALFSVVVSPEAPLRDILVVGVSCTMLSVSIFFGYAMLFSTGRAMASYIRLRRWFEGLFAVFFGAAGLKILTARLG